MAKKSKPAAAVQQNPGPDPRLDPAEKRRMEIELVELGGWPEHELQRRRIRRRLELDAEARQRDKKKRRWGA